MSSHILEERMSWLFPYPGGKSHLAPLIVKYLPVHNCYVEPFGGSIAILLEKTPSLVEIINDLDQDIVHFFKVIREAGSSEVILKRITWLCEMTPMSRFIYESWHKDWKKGIKPDDPIERAAVWYFLQCCSINGLGGWIHSEQKNKAVEWQNHVANLDKATKRLKSVEIECEDFSYIIKTYDNKGVLFYLDPPYFGVQRASEYYPGAPPMSDDRHIELAELLNNIKGKAILSYYPHPLLKKLYPEPKWRWLRKSIPKYSQGVNEECIKERGEELLIMNYEPMPLFQQLEEDISWLYGDRDTQV